MNTLIVIIMSKKHDLFFRDGRDDCDGILDTAMIVAAVSFSLVSDWRTREKHTNFGQDGVFRYYSA